MGKEYFVIASFDTAESARKALGGLKQKGVGDRVEYYSPFPEHHLEDEKFEGKKRSPVRRFTLLGATTGCLGAFLFTSWMSLDYPIRVSAKPLLSYPAFVVVAFECTILLAGIFTLLSMFHFSRIPNLIRPASYRPSFSEGTFGVTVMVDEAEAGDYEAFFSEYGAKGVEVQYGG
ncbi:MAG TPA: DUF3341 domain-containing protein [Oligoflexia bacterium]|nr:DUF3341 domain-containing protein [Oligoflexia bacterium]HMP49073.1 DUF3341 domain-containing protein [Oligoflexia bacterium]